MDNIMGGRMELDMQSACSTEGSTKNEFTKEALEEEKAVGYEMMTDDRGREVFNGVKGVPQSKRDKDWTFAIIFLFHLSLVLYAFVMAIFTEDVDNEGFESLAYFILYCAGFATLISIIIFKLMIKFPYRWIKTSLSFSLNIFLAVALFSFWIVEPVICVLTATLFAVSSTYGVYNWKRIPYIESNFCVAVDVVRSNIGLFYAALIIQALAIMWALIWVISATWAKDSISFWMVFVFFVSYMWVEQILKNLMHVTVAGVVGKWWGRSSSTSARHVRRSLRRAFSTSFGSICFGSMFVNYFLGLRNLVSYSQGKRGCWRCLFGAATCLLDCTRDILVYMNKWGFVYAGLYGYSFFQGGKNVAILFRGKGWKGLITDDLADNIIFILNLAIATVTGFVGWLFSNTEDHYYTLSLMYTHPGSAGFCIGFLVGYLISSVLLGVLGGAVNAIIVCFAESPVEFQRKHPRHSQELRHGWALELPKPTGGRSWDHA